MSPIERSSFDSDSDNEETLAKKNRKRKTYDQRIPKKRDHYDSDSDSDGTLAKKSQKRETYDQHIPKIKDHYDSDSDSEGTPARISGKKKTQGRYVVQPVGSNVVDAEVELLPLHRLSIAFVPADDEGEEQELVNEKASAEVKPTLALPQQTIEKEDENNCLKTIHKKLTPSSTLDLKLHNPRYGMVKSRVDNALYAVKKIRLKKNDMDDKIKEEIQYLARLNHPNVIRYHCSWFGEEQYTSPSTTDEEETRSSTSSDEQQQSMIKIPGIPAVRKSSSDSPELAAESSKLPLAESSVGDRQIQRKITPPSILVEQLMSLTLYIQMELCTTTLDKHLQKRNDQAKLTGIIDGEFNLSLYNQLLSALQYIHDDNIHIIHRDIKPANIFLKSDHRSYRILLGDFGLACGDSIGPKKDVLEEEETILVTPGSSKPRTLLTSGVGTVLYAAPEQRTQSNYYSAVDIYSAGIVLYEAYNIFSTSMERQRNIEKLKAERKVDEYLEKKWPSFAPVILSMTEVDPSKRPTAGQLLQQFKEDESASNLALQEIINSQNEKIVTLEKALAKATTADPCGGPVNSTQDQPGLFNSSQVASSSAQHQPQSPPMK